MLNINVEVSYPLSRDWGEEKTNGHSFRTEMRDGAMVAEFLKVLSKSNSTLRQLLLTPGGEPTGLVAITVNNRRLEYRGDLETQLRDKDRVFLALDHTGC